MSPILDGMGYESLSTVVVLVIVVIAIAVWLPARTTNGMKRAAEHRQDRYSPSLRIVEAADGRRFGDIEPYQAKGAAMPASTGSARLTTEHIAHVRELRREAIRRRQIVVISLLVVTIAVFVLAFAAHYSPLFALIPLALVVFVLVMGARAARQAREWEHRVSRYEKEHKPDSQVEQQVKAAAAEPVAQVANHADDDAATEIMEQRQIRRVLHDAEVEQAKAKALREEKAKAQSEMKAEHEPAASQPEHRETEESSLTVRDERDAHDVVVDDATSELSSVRPARALDVFDMATSQDLISFSLGASDDEDNAPESLEIKSTRQVSKATPVKPEIADNLIDEAKAVKASDDASAAKAQANQRVSQPESFHEHEEKAEVEAPVATSESLSVGLDSILARRGN